MFHRRLHTLNLALMLALLVVTAACSKKENPTQPGTGGDAALVGTWNVISINGQDASQLGAVWVFTNTDLTASFNGCNSKYTYSASNGTVVATVVTDPCDSLKAGSKLTYTYSIANNQLTVQQATTQGTMVIVLQKNGTGTQTSPLVGTWYVVTIDGEDVTLAGAKWVFTADRATYTSQSQSCTMQTSYTSTATSLVMTVISDGCANIPAGTQSTGTYSISGETMTLSIDGNVWVMVKSSQTNPLLGLWTITAIDGDPVEPGESVLSFTASQMVHATAGLCTAVYNYTRSGTQINIQVVQSDCLGLEPGMTDTAIIGISGNTLTITFSDGTVVVAQRL